MEKINDGLKALDIYGDYFYFRIGNQTKYKTAFGGLLSTLTIAVFIFVLYEFGINFVSRLNPSTSAATSFYNATKSSFLYQDMYSENTVILGVSRKLSDNINFTVLNFISLDGSNIEISKSTVLPQCRIDDIEYFRQFNLSQMISDNVFFCFNTNDYNMSEFNNYDLSMKLAYIYGAMNFHSTNYSDSLNDFDLEILNRKITFSPNDYYSPFVVKYDFEIISLKRNMSIFSNILYEKLSLVDDNGWLLKTSISKNEISLNRINSYDYISGHDFSYGFKIGLKDIELIYYRSYMKIQDLLAQIGGFMKAIFLLMNLIGQFIRNYKVDMYILSKFIREENNVKDESLNVVKEYDKFEIESSVKIKNNIIDESPNKNEQISLEKKKIQEAIIEAKENSINRDCGYDVEKNSNSKRDLDVNSKDIVIDFSEKSANRLFTFCNYLKTMFCNFFNLEINKNDENLFQLKMGLMICDQYKNVDYIIEKLHELEILKRIIFNEHQMISLDFIKSPDLFIENELLHMRRKSCVQTLSNSDKRNQIVNYFLTKKNDCTFLDQNILQLLPNSVKKFIIEEDNQKP